MARCWRGAWRSIIFGTPLRAFYKEPGRGAWAPRGGEVDGLGERLSVLGGETGEERLTDGVDGYRGFNWPGALAAANEELACKR